jgi:hypothetical protein
VVLEHLVEIRSFPSIFRDTERWKGNIPEDVVRDEDVRPVGGELDNSCPSTTSMTMAQWLLFIPSNWIREESGKVSGLL